MFFYLLHKLISILIVLSFLLSSQTLQSVPFLIQFARSSFKLSHFCICKLYVTFLLNANLFFPLLLYSHILFNLTCILCIFPFWNIMYIFLLLIVSNHFSVFLLRTEEFLKIPYWTDEIFTKIAKKIVNSSATEKLVFIKFQITYNHIYLCTFDVFQMFFCRPSSIYSIV